MKKLIRFFIDNAKIFNTLTVVLLAAGLYEFVNGKKEGFPNIKFDQIFITTVYPGASAEEIERIITRKIENEVKRVNGAKKVTSKSVENLSTVVFDVETEASKNFQKVLDDIKSAVDKVQLPDGVEDPTVVEISSDLFPAISVVVTGDVEERLQMAVRAVEEDLKAVRGVGKVERAGYRDREIWIEANPEKLRSYNLTLAEVVGAIRMRNINLPAGKIEIQGNEYLVRTRGQYQKLEDIADTVVRANADGQAVRVKDIAELKWAFEEPTQVLRSKGTVGIRINVMKNGSGDIIKVADAVKDIIQKYNSNPDLLPGKVKLFYTDDQSYYVKRRLGVLEENAFYGLIFVVLCLLLFFDGVTTFWATAGVPIVFCTALVYLRLTGVTLNLMSMFGFIIVIGLLVDDAVVVAENIFRHREMGKDPMQATVDGAAEVWQPVQATTMTTIIAFVPLMLLPGIFGKFLGIIPVVTTICLLLSLVETFAFLPGRLVHSMRAIQTEKKENVKGFKRVLYEGAGTKFFIMLGEKYRRFLKWLLATQKTTVRNLAIVSLLNILILIGAFMVVKKEFFSGNAEEFIVNIELPASSPLIRTEAAIDETEKLVLSALSNDVRELLSTAGSQNLDMAPKFRTFIGMVRVILNSDTDKTDSEIRTILEAQVAKVQGLTSYKVGMRRGGPPQQAPVAVKIFGDDLNVLKHLAEGVRSNLAAISNTTSVLSSYEEEKNEFMLSIDEAKALSLGVSMDSAAFALRSAFKGAEATVANSMQGEDADVTVIVKYPEEYRKSVNDISQITVINRMGKRIPLASFARIISGKSITVIDREEEKRVVTISSELINTQDRNYNSQAINEMIEPIVKASVSAQPGYKYKLGGEEEDRQELNRGAALAFLLALVSIYILLLWLFRSFIQPVIVMIVVPYSVAGVILGLWISNAAFGMMAIIGVVALVGVIVKSTIIMTSFINNLRARGMGRLDAVIEGSVVRLRPILATSITGFIGLIPLAYGLGGEEPFLQPLAIALSWGLAFGTFITLIVLPCVYYILDGGIEWSMTKIGWKYKLPYDMEGQSLGIESVDKEKD